MSNFQEVLQKARDEGRIDPRLLPWDKPVHSGSKQNRSVLENIKMPPQLLALTDDVIGDFQKTIENIRLEAESRSLRVIGITGAVPGQGASTFAAVLGLLMAAMEQTSFDQVSREDMQAMAAGEAPKPGVLLIDAHLREASLHKKFGMAAGGGLIDVLEKKIPFNHGIRRISHSGLLFMSTGENNQFNLTPKHIEKLKYYLSVLKTKIDFVLLDIPPLLQYAEGITLSKLCDGMILVVGAGETRWEVVQQAKRVLEKANVRLMGAVLNRRKFYISSWVYKNI